MTTTDKKVSDMEIEPKWIFWVTHVQSQSIRIQSYSIFIKCIVNSDQISIENHPSIRIAEIQECGHALITRFHSIHTKLLMKDGRMIEIAVADPFYPNFKNRNNASEAWAFKEIINELMAGQQPNHLNSPYDRAKHKAKFYPDDANYDPHVSPLEYYHRYRKRWSALEIIVRVTMTVIISILMFLIIVLIAQYLGA